MLIIIYYYYNTNKYLPSFDCMEWMCRSDYSFLICHLKHTASLVSKFVLKYFAMIGWAFWMRKLLWKSSLSKLCQTFIFVRYMNALIPIILFLFLIFLIQLSFPSVYMPHMKEYVLSKALSASKMFECEAELTLASKKKIFFKSEWS